MNKAEFKEKRKKLLEQRVRPTEGTEAVSAWDYDFNDSNEVLQSGEVELLENMTSIVPEDRPKTGEIFKEKRNKTRHKLDAPILRTAFGLSRFSQCERCSTTNGLDDG